MEALQNYADKLLQEYKELLNLSDWDIKITMQTEQQYAKKHGKRFCCITNGCATIYQTRKRARIFIKTNLDHATMTNCIIHEIVHIPLNDIYATGLTAMMDLEDTNKKDEYIRNWEWQIEASVCRITSALDTLRTRTLSAKAERPGGRS